MFIKTFIHLFKKQNQLKVKTKQELLDSAIKKRRQGKSYRAISNRLSVDCQDDEMLKEIVEEVEAMEKKKELIVPRTFPVQHYTSNEDKEFLIKILIVFLCLGALVCGAGMNVAAMVKLALLSILWIIRD